MAARAALDNDAREGGTRLGCARCSRKGNMVFGQTGELAPLISKPPQGHLQLRIRRLLRPLLTLYSATIASLTPPHGNLKGFSLRSHAVCDSGRGWASPFRY